MSDMYLVIGAGKSGLSSCALLRRKGEKFLLLDTGSGFDREKFLKDHSEFGGYEVTGDEPSSDVIKSCRAAVFSPGVPVDTEFADRIRSYGVPIWGEVELAYRMGQGTVIGITGTNGKTTTTALTGEIMKIYYDDVYVVGNIGIPYTGVADKTGDKSVIVAEISSFMLETIDEFHPRVSAILNITPDHLNRHHTMENYIKAKENIVKNQTADDVCVLNYEDKVLREFGSTLKTKVIFFSSKERVPGGIYTEDGEIISEINGDRTPIIKTAELNIVGAHNHENAMAAIACAISMNVPLECIRSALRSFKAVEHRIEFVTEKRGVRFYDDSKGTNPDAAIKAVDAMDRPTLLIGGGYDKGIPFDEWVSHFKGKVKEIELIGTTAKTIAETCDRAGFKDYHMCNSLEEAIDRAYEMADSGDAVLLSPACASWDMFKSFEERGDIFKEYVRKLNE